MEITQNWLIENHACSKGVIWFISQKETEAVKVLKKLITENKLEWANWTICRVFDYTQKIQYEVFAAEQIIDSYEIKYPDDKRPRQTIEAAKKYIESPSKKNTQYVVSAAHASAATHAAAHAAAHAAVDISTYAAAYAAMKIKLLNYGIKLLERKI